MGSPLFWVRECDKNLKIPLAYTGVPDTFMVYIIFYAVFTGVNIYAYMCDIKTCMCHWTRHGSGFRERQRIRSNTIPVFSSPFVHPRTVRRSKSSRWFMLSCRGPAATHDPRVQVHRLQGERWIRTPRTHTHVMRGWGIFSPESAYCCNCTPPLLEPTWPFTIFLRLKQTV